MSIISKMFSPKGELNRKEYLIYGLVVPVAILVLAIVANNAAAANSAVKALVTVGFLLAIYIGFVATLKRARETASSTFLTMILWLIVTPLVILYLLVAAPKTGETKQSVSIVRVIVLLFVVIIVLGIVGAFVIPKFAKQHNTQVQQTQAMPAPQKK